MTEYTQGICKDGAAILKDGEMMTIEEILEELRRIPVLEAERDAALLGEAHYMDKEQAVIRRLNAKLNI